MAGKHSPAACDASRHRQRLACLRRRHLLPADDDCDRRRRRTRVLYFLFDRTSFGRQVRALATDRETANCRASVCAAGLHRLRPSSVAALAGILIAPLSSVDLTLGFNVMLTAFAAAILGGFGSLTGVIVGSLIIGLVQQLVGGYVLRLQRSAALHRDAGDHHPAHGLFREGPVSGSEAIHGDRRTVRHPGSSPRPQRRAPDVYRRRDSIVAIFAAIAIAVRALFFGGFRAKLPTTSF